MARGGHKNCGAQQWCAHLGPLVCEHHAAMWAGADPRELVDPAASQGHGRLTRCGTHCPAALAPTCACVPRPCAGAVGAVCRVPSSWSRRAGLRSQDRSVPTTPLGHHLPSQCDCMVGRKSECDENCLTPCDIIEADFTDFSPVMSYQHVFPAVMRHLTTSSRKSTCLFS